LIGGDDDENYGCEAGDEGLDVTVSGGGLQIAAEPRKLEAAIAHGKHLAGDQCEPSTGDRDDGVPHKADGRVRHFELPEALPCGVAIDARGFNHLARDAFE